MSRDRSPWDEHKDKVADAINLFKESRITKAALVVLLMARGFSDREAKDEADLVEIEMRNK